MELSISWEWKNEKNKRKKTRNNLCSSSHCTYKSTRKKKRRRNREEAMATISFRPLPSVRVRTFRPIFASSSNGAPLSKARPGGPVVMEIPLEKIKRPLMRTRTNDPNKVQELMDSIKVIGLQVPIDVLEVDGVYYGFSGCHRYEAHQQLGLPTIRCKVRRGTKNTLRHHMR
ncbi:hypothetical protein LUZ60_005182 [Juncus effusus]|nr:hypothetical protein LUZ60_005182 [Juncus effusus]